MYAKAQGSSARTLITVLAAASLIVGVGTASSAARKPAAHPTQGSDSYRLTCNSLEPFVVEIPGGLANSAAVGSANPEIIIDSDGAEGSLVVKSVLIKTNVPFPGFVALALNHARLNGTVYSTRTANLVGHIGSGVTESADLLGTNVRTSSLLDPDGPIPGGTVPQELIVSNFGADDIEFQLFARSDTSDLEIESVRVSGWKRRGDSVSVTYVPGS